MSETQPSDEQVRQLRHNRNSVEGSRYRTLPAHGKMQMRAGDAAARSIPPDSVNPFLH
jgi:hypothetical protein